VQLVNAGIAAEMDHQARSLKSQFKQADRLSAQLTVVVGPDEAAAGEATVRDMRTREETRVALDDLIPRVDALLRRYNR